MFDYDGSITEPCKCFLCERSFENGEAAVSPGFNYEPDYPSRLWGAKLVCENCINALAEYRGWVSGLAMAAAAAVHADDLARVTAERDAATAQLDEGLAGLVKLLDKERTASKRSTGSAKSAATGKSLTLEH